MRITASIRHPWWLLLKKYNKYNAFCRHAVRIFFQPIRLVFILLNTGLEETSGGRMD